MLKKWMTGGFVSLVLLLFVAQSQAATVVMHPGWVKTDLGGANADITVDVSVAGMLEVIGGLGLEDTGRFIDYQGEELPW